MPTLVHFLDWLDRSGEVLVWRSYAEDSEDTAAKYLRVLQSYAAGRPLVYRSR